MSKQEEPICFNCLCLEDEETSITFDEDLEEDVCTVCLPEFKEWSWRPN